VILWRVVKCNTLGFVLVFEGNYIAYGFWWFVAVIHLLLFTWKKYDATTFLKFGSIAYDVFMLYVCGMLKAS